MYVCRHFPVIVNLHNQSSFSLPKMMSFGSFMYELCLSPVSLRLGPVHWKVNKSAPKSVVCQQEVCVVIFSQLMLYPWISPYSMSEAAPMSDVGVWRYRNSGWIMVVLATWGSPPITVNVISGVQCFYMSGLYTGQLHALSFSWVATIRTYQLQDFYICKCDKVKSKGREEEMAAIRLEQDIEKLLFNTCTTTVLYI